MEWGALPRWPDGGRLRSLVDKDMSLLPIDRVIDIGAQIAEVLAAAHETSLVHRDIKPENIFIEGGSSVKVVDFGLAFISAHDGSLGRLTQDGVLGGTPAYMSPEQAQSEAISASSDIYSRGCLLYEMCCGEVPFVGSVPETLARHMYMPAKPLGGS